jgi:hypothetical protein
VLAYGVANDGGAAHLSGCNLTGAVFRGAGLYWSIFFPARLASANFERAQLQGADSKQANLSNANLRDANLGRDNVAGQPNFKVQTWKARNFEGRSQTAPSMITCLRIFRTNPWTRSWSNSRPSPLTDSHQRLSAWERSAPSRFFPWGRIPQKEWQWVALYQSGLISIA